MFAWGCFLADVCLLFVDSQDRINDILVRRREWFPLTQRHDHSRRISCEHAPEPRTLGTVARTTQFPWWLSLQTPSPSFVFHALAHRPAPGRIADGCPPWRTTLLRRQDNTYAQAAKARVVRVSCGSCSSQINRSNQAVVLPRKPGSSTTYQGGTHAPTVIVANPPYAHNSRWVAEAPAIGSASGSFRRPDWRRDGSLTSSRASLCRKLLC